MENDVREKISETARCIFLKEGYKRTTINSVAWTVGISPSTIYLHFNEKKGLFENLDISEEEALQNTYNTNRASILQTALILFGEHGYDGVSMDMLTRGSGYPRAMLYRYFKDKEKLYPAVMQEAPFYLNFLSIQPGIDGYDLEAAIKKIGLACLAVFNTSEHIAFTRTTIRDSKRRPEVSSTYHKNGISYVTRCVEAVLKRYTGDLQGEVDLHPVAETCVDSLFGLTIQYKIVVGIKPRYKDDEVVDTLTKILLHGILHRIQKHPGLQGRALGLTGREQREGNVCLSFGTTASWSPF